MKVLWSGAANRDVSAIWDYLNNESPRAATAMVRKIHAATRMLARQPYAGRPGRTPSVRELVVTRTPYLLFYEVRADELMILHVRHGRQQWPPTQ